MANNTNIDIDSIALDVARRFTADDAPRDRARMQLRIIDAIKGERACGQPIAWIRFCSDGTYEGPIHDSQMDSIRRRSGVWTPLGDMGMNMSVAGSNHD